MARCRKILAAVVLLALVMFIWASSVMLFRDGTLKEPPRKKLIDLVTDEDTGGGVIMHSPNKEMFRYGKLGQHYTKQDPTLQTIPDKVLQKYRTLNVSSFDVKEENHEATISMKVTPKQSMALEEYRWEEEQARRKAILKDACAQHPTLNMTISTLSRSPHLLWPFIYDDKYKVIYCSICKVASTTWKSVFLVLMGKYNSTQEVDLGQWYNLDRSLHTLRNLRNAAEIEKRLRTYKKFIFVREPFSRELSGYRNKLFRRNKYYQKTVGTKIIRQFRQNPDMEALQTGVGVTFTEFVKHLTKTRTESLDIHWRPMYKMVLPCAVDYDYIGHLETTDEDTKNILVKTGINKVVEVPPVTSNLSNSNEIFNRFYQELDNSLLQDMYNVFKLDSELFGYKLPELVARKIGRKM